MSLAAPNDWLDDEEKDEVVARSVSSAFSIALFMFSVSSARALVAVGALAAAVGYKNYLYSKKECDENEDDVDTGRCRHRSLVIIGG